MLEEEEDDDDNDDEKCDSFHQMQADQAKKKKNLKVANLDTLYESRRYAYSE